MVEPDSQILSQKEQERRSEYWKREREKKEREESRKIWYQNKPKFYFASVENEYGDIRAATAARLFYLGAHMKYDGGLQQKRKSIRYGDLPAILGISKSAVWRFWQEVNGKYLFQNKDGTLHMPDAIFHRGRFHNDRRYQQIFIDSVKTVYEMMPTSRKQYLGYVFQLIPYINWQYNILCHNIDEPEYDCIEPMTVDEFCEAVGYSPENKHKLLRIYRDHVVFPVNGQIERFCSFVTDGTDIDSARIFVNPHILYHGQQPERVYLLGEFSKTGKFTKSSQKKT